METIEAHDWITHATTVEAKLAEAAEQLRSLDHPTKRERKWLDNARKLLAELSERTQPLLASAAALPEIAPALDEIAAQKIGPWADAVERLLAGLTFHAGPRAPIVEALFPHKKMDSLRRAKIGAARTYAEELHRRLTSAYVERVLGTDEFSFTAPVVEEVKARYAEMVPPPADPLEDEAAEALRTKMREAAQEAELRVKQARLLTEAAAAVEDGFFKTLGIPARPKKRAAPKPATPVAVETEPAPVADAAPQKKPARKASAKKRKRAKAKPRAKPAAKPAAAAAP